MKKFLVLLLMFISVFALAGCNKETYEIALITDKGDIDDKSFNQGAWEGVLKYVAENKVENEDGELVEISHKYYKPASDETEAYISAIELAISNGAKIVVTPGFLFEPAVNVTQKNYPDVKFVILDGSPKNVENGTLESNTYSIFYAEEQSGYLAGYAAVMDGYRSLGFMGGMAVPAVVRFGHGFVIGADAAAQELELEEGAITIQYHYTGNFIASPEVQAKAAAMYSEGAEVIFACGGAVGQSVMRAAEAATNKKVIGVDVDQSADSETVITSATKQLGTSVYQALDAFYNNKWNTVGGKSVSLDASKDGIGLPWDNSQFENFTKAQYDAIYEKLADGTIEIDHKAETNDVMEVEVSAATVIEEVD